MTSLLPLFDREPELKKIEEIINENDTCRIIWIQAAGGIGKTRLLQEIYSLYSGSKHQTSNLLVADILDFDNLSYHIAENVGQSVASMLGEAKFSGYLKELEYYHGIQRDEWRSIFQIEEQYKKAKKSFEECFKKLTQTTRVILLVDTTDNLKKSDIDNLFWWVRSVKNTVVIIAGRNANEVAEWILPDKSDAIISVNLLPLSDLASRQYLEAKLDQKYCTFEEDISKKIIFLAQGRPILIDLAVEWLTRNIPLPWLIQMDLEQLRLLNDAEKISKHKEFCRKLVQHLELGRSDVDELILWMARVYPLDVNMVIELLDNDLTNAQAESLFERMREYVFVKSLPNRSITLHDEMRRMVNEYVWDTIDPTKSQREAESNKIIDCLTKKEKSLVQAIDAQPSHSERQILERELGAIQERLLSHALFSKPAKGLEIFIRLFEEGTNAYKFEQRERLYSLVQLHNPIVSPEQEVAFNSCIIRYLNDLGKFENAQILAQAMLRKEGELKPKEQLDILTYSGRSYELSRCFDDAFTQYKKALTICEVNPNLAPLKGTLLNNLGRVNRELRFIDRAVEYYHEALFIAEDQFQVAAALNNMGYVWSLQGRYSAGVEYCRKALLIYRKLGAERQIGTTLTTMGEVCRNWGKYKEAIVYYNEAEKHFEREKDLVWLARLKNFRGAVYRLQRKFSEALSDLQESLSYDILTEQAWTYHVIGCVCWNQEKYDLAETYFEKSYQLASQVNDIRSRVNNLVGYAELYFDKWKASKKHENRELFSQIREKAQQLDELLRQNHGFPHHHGRMKRTLADVFFEERNYDQAFEYYRDAFTILGSRLGGYARIRTFEDEVAWLTARISELNIVVSPELSIEWCKAFRSYWESEELLIMQRDLLLSMCDICEIESKMRLKGLWYQ